MGGREIDLDALYRAPITVCGERGSGRYHATLAAWDRLVLDVQDGDHAADPEIGEKIADAAPGEVNEQAAAQADSQSIPPTGKPGLAKEPSHA